MSGEVVVGGVSNSSDNLIMIKRGTSQCLSPVIKKQVPH